MHPISQVRSNQITETQPVLTANLVAITGADATQRGADRLFSGIAFIGYLIFLHMPWKNYMSAFAQLEPVGNVNTTLFQTPNLAQQRLRMHDHARCHDIDHGLIQNPAWYQMQFVRFVARHDRVAGIRAALVTDDDLESIG